MFNFTAARAKSIAKSIGQGDYDAARRALTGTDHPVGNGLYRGTPALHLAVKIQDAGLVRLLLKRGATIDMPDDESEYLVEQITMNNRSLEVLDLLIEAGFDLERPHNRYRNFLQMAMEDHASISFIQALIERGARPQPKHLQMCVYSNNLEMLKYIISCGVNVNDAEYSNYTVLHLAAARNNQEFVEFLLANKADATILNSDGKAPWQLVPDQDSELAMCLREAAGLPRFLPKPLNWKRTDECEVSLTTAKKEIGYELTEIFNFARQTCTVIARNLHQKSESLTVKNFQDFTNGEMIAQAARALVELGGVVPGTDTAQGKQIGKKTGAPNV